MRRDYFGVSLTNLDDDTSEPQQPTLSISYTGPREKFSGWHNHADGTPLAAADVDVSFRLKRPLTTDGSDGVLAVTNRTTGEFILEVNLETREVLRFIRVARRYGNLSDGEKHYTLQLDGTEEDVAFEKATFLVYSHTGELLHQHSLIPSGVEL
ncbi:DUF5793 family protein [Haladaptatus sp. DJG-WS-42]|uniref:DUF5793 family protein n=1 Tax=Haladaptatus sp. DJG-WS-42 TaxID=3120516 RepID=UPI0030CE1D48